MQSLQFLTVLFSIALMSQVAMARTGTVHTDMGDRSVNIEEHLRAHPESRAMDSSNCPGPNDPGPCH